MPKFSDFKKLRKGKTRTGVLELEPLEPRPEPEPEPHLIEPGPVGPEPPKLEYKEPHKEDDKEDHKDDKPSDDVAVAEHVGDQSESELAPVVSVVSEDPAVTLATILVDALQLFITNQSSQSTGGEPPENMEKN